MSRYEAERYARFLVWFDENRVKLEPYALKLQNIYHGHTGRQLFKRIKMLADQKRARRLAKKAKLLKKRKKRGFFGKVVRGGRQFANPKVG